MESDKYFGKFPNKTAKRLYAREAFARIRKALQMADNLGLLESIHIVNAVDLATIRDVSPDKGFAELMRITAEKRKEFGAEK